MEIDTKFSLISVFANPITIDNGPNPVYIVWKFCIDSKFVLFTTTISKTSYSVYCPGFVLFFAVSAEDWTATVTWKLKFQKIIRNSIHLKGN